VPSISKNVCVAGCRRLVDVFSSEQAGVNQPVAGRVASPNSTASAAHPRSREQVVGSSRARGSLRGDGVPSSNEVVEVAFLRAAFPLSHAGKVIVGA